MKRLVKYQILFLIFNILIIKNLYAASEEAKVKKFVQSIGDNLVNITQNKTLSPQEKQDNIINLVDKNTNSSWISRFVLGKNYRIFSPKQREKFQSLYRKYMINSYGPQFNNFNSVSLNILKVEKQRIFYVVKCQFITDKSNAPIDFDFRIKNRNNKISIIDFVAEGVSLIESQRSEFNSAISSMGIDDFLNNLENKVKDLEKKNSNI